MKSESGNKETIEEERVAAQGERERETELEKETQRNDGAVRPQRHRHVDPLDAAVLHDG